MGQRCHMHPKITTVYATTHLTWDARAQMRIFEPS